MTNEEQEFEIITITDEDDNETELIVIDAILHEDINYLLCVENSDEIDDEADEDMDGETEAYIFKELPDPNGKPGETIIQPIEDDEEYKRIIELFQAGDYELME